MSEQPTAAERKETAYQIVRDFWQTYGDVLQQENGPGTFKYALVQKMKQIHEDNVAGSDGAMIHRKILDILGEQRTSMIQFESCLDEFNRYLAALRLLDTFILHGICMNNICPQPSERNHDERDQVQRLLAFFAPVVSLETPEDRLKTYRELCLVSCLHRPLHLFLTFFASLPPMLQPTLRQAFANRYLLLFMHDNGEINHVYLYQ